MATDDITALFEDIRAEMAKEGPHTAGQEGLVHAFEMLCIDMRRTADAIEELRGKPTPQRKTKLDSDNF